MAAQSIRIALDGQQHVSGLLQKPAQPIACYVLAHGAGAGMQHPFMNSVADGLADRHVATLRYQFPYMEADTKRPDRPAVAQGAVRAAVEAAAKLMPDVPLFAGGKSFGGRMTSQAQAETPLPGIRGLIFLGFPLHPQNKPASTRADHLSHVAIPMLFLQGGRDKLASPPLLTQVTQGLGKRARLIVIEHADHSFHVPVRSGTTDMQAMTVLLDALAAWVGRLAQ